MPLFHCGAGSSIYNGTVVALLWCCHPRLWRQRTCRDINTHTHTKQKKVTKTWRPTQREERLLINMMLLMARKTGLKRSRLTRTWQISLQHPPGLQHLRYRVFQIKSCTHTQTLRHYDGRHLRHARVAHLQKHKHCASIGERRFKCPT